MQRMRLIEVKIEVEPDAWAENTRIGGGWS